MKAHEMAELIKSGHKLNIFGNHSGEFLGQCINNDQKTLVLFDEEFKKAFKNSNLYLTILKNYIIHLYQNMCGSTVAKLIQFAEKDTVVFTTIGENFEEALFLLNDMVSCYVEKGNTQSLDMYTLEKTK